MSLLDRLLNLLVFVVMLVIVAAVVKYGNVLKAFKYVFHSLTRKLQHIGGFAKNKVQAVAGYAKNTAGFVAKAPSAVRKGMGISAFGVAQAMHLNPEKAEVQFPHVNRVNNAKPFSNMLGIGDDERRDDDSNDDVPPLESNNDFFNSLEYQNGNGPPLR